MSLYRVSLPLPGLSSSTCTASCRQPVVTKRFESVLQGHTVTEVLHPESLQLELDRLLHITALVSD